MSASEKFTGSLKVSFPIGVVAVPGEIVEPDPLPIKFCAFTIQSPANVP